MKARCNVVAMPTPDRPVGDDRHGVGAGLPHNARAKARSGIASSVMAAGVQSSSDRPQGVAAIRQPSPSEAGAASPKGTGGQSQPLYRRQQGGGERMIFGAGVCVVTAGQSSGVVVTVPRTTTRCQLRSNRWGLAPSNTCGSVGAAESPRTGRRAVSMRSRHGSRRRTAKLVANVQAASE